MSLLAALVGPVPAAWAAEQAKAGFKLRPVQQTDPVRGGSVAARGAASSETDAHPWREPGDTAWPSTARTEVDLTGAKGAAPKGGGKPAAVRAKDLPVAIAPTPDGADGPAKVAVQIQAPDTAAKLGLDGIVLSVGRADGGTAPGRADVQVDYRAFRDLHGADWASRLTMVRLPECALTTPQAAECRTVTPLPSVNDPKAGTVTASVDAEAAAPAAGGTQLLATGAAAGGTVLAATAGASGSSGDYTATPLAPSGQWTAGGSTGGFTWTYPLDAPSVPGNLEPALSLAYDSSSIDGRTASTNNQSSWIGDGWSMEFGSIERQYTACKEDGGSGSNAPAKTGDLCWKSDNATISLNGKSSALVKDDATGVWKLATDDGSRVERLNGSAADTANGDDDNEYWKVTSTDGTQYFFGKNRLPGWSAGKPETGSVYTAPVYGNQAGEPGNRPAFADSSLSQAWRWNLDYVVDPHGNAMSFHYVKESGAYPKNSAGATSIPKADTSYVRAGYLDHIEYGHRAGQVYAANPAGRVNFAVSDRCLGVDCSFTKANAASWPDVPVDQSCDLNQDCSTGSPTFWSKKRLTGITTQLLQGGSYKDVDSWALAQQFPGVGDAGGPALWLSSITRTGRTGATPITLPQVDFGGTLMANRVDGAEGRPPLNKYRITRITSESGGDTLVSYSPTECSYGATPAPDANTGRCFPSWWTPEGASEPVLDWFHKYVVTKVTENDNVAGATPRTTEYEYLGGAAWRRDDSEFTPDKRRTWNVFRGYGTVRTRTGTTNRTLTETTYFRGMDGDRKADGSTRSVSVQGVTDRNVLAGTVRETVSYDRDGGSPAVSKVNTVWDRTTATRAVSGLPALTASLVAPDSETVKTLLSDGSWRTTRSSSTFDGSHGLVQTVSDEGDLARTGDETCVRTTYVAPDTANWLVSYPASNRTSSAACAVAADQTNTIAEQRTRYDGQAVGQAPLAGRAHVTGTEDLTGFTGGTPAYRSAGSAEYDAYGRITLAKDANGFSTSTSYTPTTGEQPVSTTVTDPKQHTVTTAFDSLRTLPVGVTDANGRTVSKDYDALGRLTAAWSSGRAKASPADATYGYAVSRTAPTTVTSRTLLESGGYRTSIALYDGLLRPRQTQRDPADGTGRLVGDTFYDTHGRPYKSNAEYWNDTAPGTAVLAVADNQVPAQTVTEYDGLGRPTASVSNSLNVEKWRTITSYGGNWTAVVPPSGGTPTLSLTDSDGRTVERRQYKSGAPLPGADPASYEAIRYEYDAGGRLTKVSDQGGNAWSYTYDLMGRQTKSVDPDKGTTSVTYNTAGLVETTTDARGKVTYTSYDELDRRTALHESGPTGTKLAEWAYDGLAGGKGLPVSGTRYENGNAYVSAVLGYDALGRSTGTTVTVPAAEGKLAGSYTFKNGYTPTTGLAASTSYPAGGALPAETVYRNYTAQGLPTSVNNGTRTYSTGSSYSPFGETLQTVLGAVGGRTVQTYTFQNDTRRLATVTNDREAANPQTLDTKAYTYDPAGNVTRIRDDRDDRLTADTQCFTYDFARRLTNAWTATDDCVQQPSGPTKPKVGGPAPYWQTYGYDAVGNRTSIVRRDPALDPAKDTTSTSSQPAAGSPRPHALSGVTTTGPGARTDSFEYDAAGNTTRRVTAGGDQSLEWDSEGHLARATTVGKAASTFLYDADGNRLLRRDADATTLYLPGQELKYTKATDKVTGTRFIPVGGASAVKSSTGAVSYQLADHQGTSQVSVAATGLAVTRRDTTPFGEARGATPGTWPDEKGFVGGTADTATGLTHLGAREYDSANGRFISVDPLLDLNDPQQINGYNYANNSPVTLSDPTGLRPDGQYGGASSLMPDGIIETWAPDNNGGWNWGRKVTYGAPGMGKSITAHQTINFNVKKPQRSTTTYTEKKFKPNKTWAKVVHVAAELTGAKDVADCAKGRGGGCAWAAVGVTPIGKIVKAAKLARAAKAVEKAPDFHMNTSGASNLIRHKVEYTSTTTKSGHDRDLVRTAEAGGYTWQFKTGHGYHRPHSGAWESDLRTTGLSADAVEQGIADDLLKRMDAGYSVPRPGPGFGGPDDLPVNIGGHDVVYNAVQLPGDRLSIGTYWLKNTP